MNRRDDIIQTARQLFTRQGYHATSIRQIAAGVGCRESAIYVHFENGKRELLQTILTHHMPDFDEILRGCAPESASENAFDRLGQRMAALAQTHLQEWQWVVGEFPTLKADERAIVRAKLVELHQGLADCLQAHRVSEAAARSIAWSLVVMLSGYAQLHRVGEPDFDIGFSPDHFANMLKVLLAETLRPEEQANVQ
ncbi:TetR/AcrR family transcriptional regulator [Aggregatilinea lenta]|uniref:TetR/AcrR family transcriptional regulator n=1 Tax=Aggregatilinea lenta TaxID=913108 RepID=UPI000E5ADAEF|nr:TetR/AcrR family transcriptional regulator [Aggregatilinea lenta]